jgi:hypothetical protein
MDLYEKDFKTISEFYGTFDYYINSDDNILRRRVLMDKFNYIQAKMTDILKEKIGYKDKANIKIENLEYTIDFKKRTISHTIENGPDKGAYFTSYGPQVKDIEYLFSRDFMCVIGPKSTIINVHEKGSFTNPICSFYINDMYIDEEPNFVFSRLDSNIVFDFGDSSDEE